MSANANIKRPGGGDFTGSATEPFSILYQHIGNGDGGYWLAVNLAPGYSSSTVLAANVKMNVTAISGNDTLTTAKQYNGRVFVSAASVLNGAGVELGMEVVIVAHTDDDVDWNPDNADTITLNGTALAAGDAVRITNKGEIIACTGTGATTWSCSSDAGVDVN